MLNLSAIFWLFVPVRIVRRKKMEQFIRDVRAEMPWTFSHLQPQIEIVPHPGKDFTTRYGALKLITSTYMLMLTRQFHYGKSDELDSAEVIPWNDEGGPSPIRGAVSLVNELHGRVVRPNNMPSMDLPGVDQLIQENHELLVEYFSGGMRTKEAYAYAAQKHAARMTRREQTHNPWL